MSAEARAYVDKVCLMHGHQWRVLEGEMCVCLRCHDSMISELVR